MSALLSPAKPVRTRFKVPGEGSYELEADIPPPVPRAYPPPSPPPKPVPQATALGLTKVTSLSFVQEARLKPSEPEPEPASLFSFRKLTSFSLKFTADEEPPAAVASPSKVDVVPPPRVARREGGVLAYNSGDSVILLDLSRPIRELSTIQLKSVPTSHALSHGTEGLRLIVGCVSGEVLLYSDVSRRSSTPSHIVYNRDAIHSSSRVVCVRWVPTHIPPHKFIAVHADGIVIVYDTRHKPREEGRITPPPNQDEGARVIQPNEIVVNRHTKGKKSNPAMVWQIGCSMLTCCDFAPGGGSVVIGGKDGVLRVVDFVRETVVVGFRMYFGGVLCCKWSPDGMYVAVGGEDDLVSVFEPGEKRLVARLEGHTSWVSAVAWDETLCQKNRYRIGSAGQDAKLLLWDFALDVLHHRTPRQAAASRRKKENGLVNGADGIVEAAGKMDVPVVEPVVAHVAHAEPLTDVWFQECGVFTTDAGGGVKMWGRPPLHAVPEISLGQGGGRGATDLD